MGFSRKDYWSGLLCPPPGDLPNPGIKPASPALTGGFFTTSTPWEAVCVCVCLREREKAMCELCVDMCVYLCMCVPECMLTHICVMSVAVTAVHGMPRPTRWLDLVQ